MNNTSSLQQTSRTSNLDANLISRQCKLNLVADLMRMENENLKIKQSEIANQLGYSSSTLQRYWNDINMLSPYRIQPNNTKKRTKKFPTTNFDNYPHRNCDIKRPQMTSNDLAKHETNTTSNNRNTNVLKAGSVHENIEINEHYSDKILHKKDL